MKTAALCRALPTLAICLLFFLQPSVALVVPKLSRRQLFAVTGAFFIEPANAKTGGVTTQQFSTASTKKLVKISPDVAVKGIKLAREELKGCASNYVSKSDFTGLEMFLSSSSMTSFENNILSLLASSALDAESKKEIGTIRRYGVGADAMIMYGGLLSALEGDMGEVDSKEVKKYLERTVQSLDEILAICNSNGLG